MGEKREEAKNKDTNSKSLKCRKEMKSEQCKNRCTFNPSSPYEAAIYNSSWFGEKK